MPGPEYTIPSASSRPASPLTRRPPTFHRRVLTYVAMKVQAEVNAAEAAAWPDVFEPGLNQPSYLTWEVAPSTAPDADSDSDSASDPAPPPLITTGDDDDEPAEPPTPTTTPSTTTPHTPRTIPNPITIPPPLPAPHPTALYHAALPFYILDYRLLWANWALTRTHTPRAHERGSSSASEAARVFIPTSARAARHYQRVDIAHAVSVLEDARCIPLHCFRGSGAAYVGDADRRALGCDVRMREVLLGGVLGMEDWIARPGGGRGEESAGVVAWVVWWFGGGEREGWEEVFRGHLGRGVEELAEEGGKGMAKGVEERWAVEVERRVLVEERVRLLREMEEFRTGKGKGRQGQGGGSEVAKVA